MTRIAPATAGLLLVVLFAELALPSAFVTDHAVTAFPSRILRKRLSVPSAVNASTGDSRQSRDFNSRLLDDFKTATGELVNPYKILKVSRKADRTEIRNAYRSLSKAYHPDGFLQKKDKAILPGRWSVDANANCEGIYLVLTVAQRFTHDSLIVSSFLSTL